MNGTAAVPFRFTTKAGNLAQLEGRLATARVMPQATVRVADWDSDRAGCIDRIQRRFPAQRLIMRSSAPGEDSVEASMAGAFESILDVDGLDPKAIGAAIDAVRSSYASRRGVDIGGYEILVQPMIAAVVASGVVFTRDLDKGGPYLVLNYDDESDRTDTVTGGHASGIKTVRVFRGADPSRLPPPLSAVVRTARELEAIAGSDALDIEFAVDASGTVFLLQVRPLARGRILSFARLDARIGDELRHAREFVREKLRRAPQLLGETTVLGEMPDWNPAEIIGTRPKPLARTLYSHIIMRETWREARRVMGYRDAFPQQLLLDVAGRPYVDVRCSLNSFLPGSLRSELGERLVNHYVARLREHPEFHDKIEFEIVLTCLDLDFDLPASRLRAAGFDGAEVAEIRRALLQMTDSIVNDRDGTLARLESDVARLGPRREAILATRERASGLPMLVERLLSDCVRFGTLPFSVFARCAFIGNSFLKSMVRLGMISTPELDAFLHAIPTVTGDFVNDLERCKSGVMPLADFLARYGHLRPGTYDVCAPSYAERPERYLEIASGPAPAIAPAGAPSHAARPTSPPRLPEATRTRVAEALEAAGFTCGIDTLERFIVRSIQLREGVKFEFTRNLSAALGFLADFGEYHGLDREAVSFLPVESYLELANGSVSADWIEAARDTIERNRVRYELTAAIHLPDLIFSTADVDVVTLQRRRPNFVTQKRIVGRAVRLDHGVRLDELPDLKGALVLIENADPGFDWLFARGIGGLLTKHGGAASHMTIRCAELGIPAAIGCGEQIFSELARASTILLDCAERRVEPNA